MSPIERSSDSSKRITDWAALGWLLAILANVAVGSWLLHGAIAQGSAEPPPLLPFVLLYVAVLALLMADERRTQGQPKQEKEEKSQDDAPSRPIDFDHNLLGPWPRRRIAPAFVAVILIIVVLIRIPQLDRLDNYTFVALAWVAAIVCYILALAPLRGNRLQKKREEAGVTGRGILGFSRERLQATYTRQRLPLLLFLTLVLLALLLRASFLETIPHTLAGDEASQGLEAVRVLQGEIRNPFTTGWLGVPTLSFYFNSLTIELLGMTKTGLRLPWALVGTATVAAAFFLVRRLAGTTLALATTTLLTVYHYHIHFSRLGSNQVADPLFVTLALWFLYRALDGKRPRDWGLAGGTAGMALYFYAGARLTPVLIATVLAIDLLRHPRRFWDQHRAGVLAMIGAFFLVAAPMIQYAIRFPNEFNARLNQVGILQSGWLEQELAAGRDLVTILWDQFRRAALAFNYYPDRTVWYGLPQPLLDPVFGALFLVGLVYSTIVMWSRGKRSRRLAPLVVWWWAGMIAGGLLTESPPSSQRLITLSVPVCFFIAVALWQIAVLAQRAIGAVPARALLSVGLLAFAAISLHTYFLDFTPKRIYGGNHAELATDLAPLLNELDDTHKTYFLGAPWMYWGFGTIPYLAPDMEGEDIQEPLEMPPPPSLLPPGRGAVFVFLPQRAGELALVRRAFPGGRLHELHAGTIEGELLATLYLVPP